MTVCFDEMTKKMCFTTRFKRLIAIKNKKILLSLRIEMCEFRQTIGIAVFKTICLKHVLIYEKKKQKTIDFISSIMFEIIFFHLFKKKKNLQI